MRRKLGQYFLRSRSVLLSVVSALDVSQDVLIVEIGPGKGALTKYILDRHDFVVAVERDPSLIEVLQKRFSDTISRGRFILVSGDVRDGAWLDAVGDRPYAVIANIPYYLTGSLLRGLLTHEHAPVAMSLVVQKEVAERITKRNGEKESLLSLSVQLFGTASYIQTVARSAFSPQPHVDSAIITVTDVQQPPQCVQDAFFSVVKIAFQEKRKTVLKKFKRTPDVQEILLQQGVSDTDRAEDVPFAVWFAVAQSVVADA